MSLDDMLSKQQVSYVGTSVASAEEYHLRKKYEGIARDVFGDGLRIKNGQIIRFRDTAAHLDGCWMETWRDSADDASGSPFA